MARGFSRKKHNLRLATTERRGEKADDSGICLALFGSRSHSNPKRSSPFAKDRVSLGPGLSQDGKDCPFSVDS
jgi:hypothetical protein